MRRRALVLGLVMAVVAAGCDSTSPTEPEQAAFDASLGINLAAMTKLPSGVYIRTETAGTGTATVTATRAFVADYKGWLPNGDEFDSGTFSQPLFTSQLIPGFGDGVIGMKVGELRTIVIPSRLAYADQPPEGSIIPKHSVLIFQVSIRSIS